MSLDMNTASAVIDELDNHPHYAYPYNDNHLDKNGKLIPVDEMDLDILEVLDMMGHSIRAVENCFIERSADEFSDFCRELIDDKELRAHELQEAQTDLRLKELEEIIKQNNIEIKQLKLVIEDYDIKVNHMEIINKRHAEFKTTSSTQALVDRLRGGGGEDPDEDEIGVEQFSPMDLIISLFPKMAIFKDEYGEQLHIKFEKADLKAHFSHPDLAKAQGDIDPVKLIFGDMLTELEVLLTQSSTGVYDPLDHQTLLRTKFLVNHTKHTRPCFNWSWIKLNDLFASRINDKRFDVITWTRQTYPAMYRALYLWEAFIIRQDHLKGDDVLDYDPSQELSHGHLNIYSHRIFRRDEGCC